MTEKTITTKVTNCVDCPNHEVVRDPDPDDWFCNDDVAVLCTKLRNRRTANRTGQFKHKIITLACRPYKIREESDIPDWCPL